MLYPVQHPAGANTASLLLCSIVLAAATLLCSSPVLAQFWSYQKISENTGGFSGFIEPGDDFAESACVLGDVNGDSVTDIAIGAEEDDDGGLDRGAVWILFLNPDGTVKDHQKISSTEGGFTGRIYDGDRFGDKCAGLGDLDRDGVPDIAIGQQGDSRTRVVFLRTDGTVKSHRNLACGDGGRKIANIGDFDGDGVVDLAAGSPHQSTLGPQRGAVHICLLTTDGSIKSTFEISEVSGGFTGTLDDGDLFGNDIAGIGDLDDNGVVDIAVNAKRDDDGGTDVGAVWLLFMNANGTVKRHQKISQTEGGFQDSLSWYASFGEGVTGLGDVDGDGVEDMAVGADYANVGGRNRGAVWLLFLNPDGTIKAQERIASDTPGFEEALQDSDHFGRDLANLGDLDGDGVTDVLVTADANSNESPIRNSAYIFFLEDGVRTSGFDLLVSNFADRWGPEPLHQSTISGPVYVFVDPAEPANQIDFYVDDILMRTDGLAPYDLEGGTFQIANPFDTARLTNGLHTFKAVSLPTAGGTRTSWASVTVDNTTLNQSPVFTPIEVPAVTAGNGLAFGVGASDPDPGDTVTLSASGLPAGASFLDNGNGSGEFSWTPASGAADDSPYSVTFRATDSAGASDSETVQITVTEPGAPGSLVSESGQVAGVTDSWQRVNLANTYVSPVVVATPVYTRTAVPVVTRVRNAGSNSFELRVARADGQTSAPAPVPVTYLVVEAGVYTQAEHGITMEAVTFTSTVTDSSGSWVGTLRSYANSYTTPVVLGQVMSANDADWSVFWSAGALIGLPASASALRVGKHVGEDPDTTRANETIGYVVIEAGQYTRDTEAWVVGRGAATVGGMDNSPPYSYDVSGLVTARTAVAAQAAMAGRNGSWVVLYGASAISASTLQLAVDEDQLLDAERLHVGEPVAYLVVGR